MRSCDTLPPSRVRLPGRLPSPVVSRVAPIVIRIRLLSRFFLEHRHEASSPRRPCRGVSVPSGRHANWRAANDASPPLNYFKTTFVTGDFFVEGVGLNQNGTGNITINEPALVGKDVVLGVSLLAGRLRARTRPTPAASARTSRATR